MKPSAFEYFDPSTVREAVDSCSVTATTPKSWRGARA